MGALDQFSGDDFGSFRPAWYFWRGSHVPLFIWQEVAVATRYFRFWRGFYPASECLLLSPFLQKQKCLMMKRGAFFLQGSGYYEFGYRKITAKSEGCHFNFCDLDSPGTVSQAKVLKPEGLPEIEKLEMPRLESRLEMSRFSCFWRIGSGWCQLMQRLERWLFAGRSRMWEVRQFFAFWWGKNYPFSNRYFKFFLQMCEAKEVAIGKAWEILVSRNYPQASI